MVELEVVGVIPSSEADLLVVYLRNENVILPILVGLAEASAIHRELMGLKPPRPMTHDLICNLLAGLGGNLQSVTIYKLEEGTFFAHLNIEQLSSTGQVEQVLRVDSRPSDGIAIAVRACCPIYASEEVMDAAGQDASQLLSAAEDQEDRDIDFGDEGEGFLDTE